jgi:hypothetical protein
MQMMGIWRRDGVSVNIIFQRHENGKTGTLVFLIKALSAPTPPLSPADIPSTSSMIKHVLSVTGTPAAFVV